MERWACVDVPALPLQLLMLRNPAWREARAPVVVVDIEKPQGRVVWANRHARSASVRPGMRYAAALSIVPSLRAGVVDEDECEAAVEQVVERLQAFSPAIEPSRRGVDQGGGEVGVFWVDASGLEGVFASLDDWGDRLREDLRCGAGLHAAVAIGFSRFGSYALARSAAYAKFSASSHGVCIAGSPDEEEARADCVSLDLLQIDTKLRAALDRLGVREVGALRRLPEGGLAARFGQAGRALARFVSGYDADGRVDMLVPRVGVEPVTARYELEPGDVSLDAQALLFLIKARLGPMCAQLAARGQALRSLRLQILFDRSSAVRDVIEPAEPTLDELQMLDLVRLRLERVDFAAEVLGFELEAVGVRATREQLELFAERPRRDLRAAGRALARLRAEFGEDTVVCARLRAGHLPEGTFCWRPVGSVHVLDVEERMRRLTAADPVPTNPVPTNPVPTNPALTNPVPKNTAPTNATTSHTAVPEPSLTRRGCLVRRIWSVPRELPRDRHEPDGWFAAGLQSGPVRRTFGPYVLSGGWWRRRRRRRGRPGAGADVDPEVRSNHAEVHRAYHFAETSRGDVLWVFYDRVRRRWYLHGVVE